MSAVSAGGYSSLAVSEDGKRVAWGALQRSDLDDITDLNGSSSSSSRVVLVSAGEQHCAAVRANGTVALWGTHPDQQPEPPAEAPRRRASGPHFLLDSGTPI
ncbi:hypothetical protein DIPPA_11155 [Diplonema papillatum]|nr:hypothetical protein DIPPA_11155 [Diplonema papillatum]